MRFALADSEKKCSEIESSLSTSRNDLNFFLELKEQAELLFEGKHSNKFSVNQAKETFAQHQNINRNNYKKLDNLIETEKINIKTYEEQLTAERKILKESL